MIKIKQNAMIRWGPVLFLFLLLIFTGLRGIDFGFHWDERTHALGIKHTAKTGVLLPGIYLYPGVSYWLSLVGALPDFVAYQTSDDKNLESLLNAIEGKDYRLRSRIVFLITSALALLCIYVLVLTWRKSIFEAFIAASVLGLSWEFAYHIRWIAPDGVLVTFGALTLLCVIRAHLDPINHGWLWMAALSAGVAFGTKWPAGLLLISVCLVGFLNTYGIESIRSQVFLVTKIFLLFIAVYLLTTPATIFDWPQLWKYIKMQQDVYSGGLQGYAVPTGPVHFFKILEFFALVYPSKFKAISLIWFFLSGIGLYSLYRNSPKMALLLLSFPILYIGFFSFQGMMVVRNYLVVGPFFAVLAARGAMVLIERSRKRFQKRILSVAFMVLITINALWLVHAGETIRQTVPREVYQDLILYIQGHPRTSFVVSKKIGQTLNRMGAQSLTNVTSAPGQNSDAAIFYAYEMLQKKGIADVPANRPDMTITWFGPYEVNFNYYPTWQGSDRVLVTTLTTAKELGFPFAPLKRK